MPTHIILGWSDIGISFGVLSDEWFLLQTHGDGTPSTDSPSVVYDRAVEPLGYGPLRVELFHLVRETSEGRRKEVAIFADKLLSTVT